MKILTWKNLWISILGFVYTKDSGDKPMWVTKFTQLLQRKSRSFFKNENTKETQSFNIHTAEAD